jgi:stage III sporulation protein AA
MPSITHITDVAQNVERILHALPAVYRDAYRALSLEQKSLLSEIRIRANRPSSFTVAGVNIPVQTSLGVVMSSVAEIREILDIICDGSLYSHSSEIGKGYINALGTRIGVSGIACNYTDGVADFSMLTSLNFRIPRHLQNAADDICEYILKRGIDNNLGVLAVSPPNCGKTTFLRALAEKLSYAKGPFGLRVCIADERGEMDAGNALENCFCDCISGMPKLLSAEIAARTLSAQVLIVDEIGNEDEADGIMAACGSGVYVAASIHGRTLREACERGYVSKLVSSGMFKTVYTLNRCNDRIEGRISDIGEELDAC